jgi:hypothetical protein
MPLLTVGLSDCDRLLTGKSRNTFDLALLQWPVNLAWLLVGAVGACRFYRAQACRGITPYIDLAILQVICGCVIMGFQAMAELSS